MAFESLGGGALNYCPCQYGVSKLVFRGPPKNLDEPYCAVIGGSETYGKHQESPYPDLLGGLIGIPVANLGYMNAGTDVFGRDETVLDICNKAELTVIQIMGAQNMSNKYYSVHPRRNDRFLQPSKLLRALYRDVDFANIHFTGHLMNVLAEGPPEKFTLVRDGLRKAWVDRMQSILDRIDGPVVLLWLAQHAPDDVEQSGLNGPEPMFVDRDMLCRLSGQTVDIVGVIASEDEILAGQSRMVFTALEELVAREMMGPVVHERVAQALYAAMV